MLKSQELNQLTIKQAAEKLDKREISSVELTNACLKQIKKNDNKINAYLSVFEETALSQAKKADERRAKGETNELLGIPMAVKDNILIADLPCTAGSKILENYIAPYDATVIKKLRDAGAIFLGKTNMDEFAMGSSTENSGFFPTKNPHDLSRVPGGTSGGSAAAVAADDCCYALGSDTGGSIRQPASFCGVVGLKPTYGAVSRYGLISFASSLDQIGLFAKTAEDAKIIFEAIKGKDELDSTSAEPNFKSKILNLKSVKIGIPKEYFIEGMEIEVEKIIKNAIKKIEALGVKIEEISLPHSKYALACYYIICTSEASTNLARYDGIRYGCKSQIKSQIQNLTEVYLENRGQGFGTEVKRRIMLGTYALSTGYYEAYYLKAQKVRTLIKQDFDKAFEKIDFVLTPTSPTPAFKLGEKTKDLLQMYLSDIFTVPVSLAGIPALSLPIGKTQGLPVGLQIIGKPFQEKKILNFANYLEKNINI